MGNTLIDVDWHTPNVGYYWKEDSKVVGFSIVESIDGYFEIVDFCHHCHFDLLRFYGIQFTANPCLNLLVAV